MTQRCIAGGIWSKTISPKSRSSAPSPRDTTRQSKASAPTSTLPLRSSPQGKCQQTLECWPLKAANGVTDAAPGQAATEVASKRQRLNCTNIGQLFLVPDIGPYDLFSPPDVETKYPTRCSGQQNFFGILARTWWANDSLSLDKSDHPRSALFKGITIIL